MVMRAKPKRMYRTMQGRMVDIEKLRAANEGVQAVGNMNVNARGDILGAGGNVVTSKAQVMKQYYEKPKGMVDDTPSNSKQTPAPKVEVKKQIQKMTPMASKPAPQKAVAPTPKVEAKPVEATPVETFKPKTESSSKKGIDAALDGLE
jgi:hypothetical protein